MTDKPALSYAAQLILTLPGQGDAATIIVTLMPDDTIPVEGQKKALADCTLRELRRFANTLEGEVWETYEAITLLDLAKDKNLSLTVTLLDKDGKAAEPLQEWASSVIVFPAEKSSTKATTVKATSKAPSTAKSEKAPPPTPAKESAPKTAPDATETTESKEPTAGATTETRPKAASQDMTDAAAKQTIETKSDAADLASAITFPAPVKKEAVEAAKAKEPARPHVPATIEPSEARVRVAGKRLPPGTNTWAAVDILMDEPPLRAMQAHALSSLDREVAGVMVGPRPEKQPDGRYLVRVIDSIAAKYTVMQGASVTYTADSWRYLNDTLGERYPNETGVMVGWYHTHPGFGIFLSGMDQFIHQNFFTQIWHTAYVLDPRARTSGFFCWSRDKSRVNHYDFVWPDWADGSW